MTANKSCPTVTHTDHIVNYSGVVTDVTQIALGTFTLDDKVRVYLCWPDYESKWPPCVVPVGSVVSVRRCHLVTLPTSAYLPLPGEEVGKVPELHLCGHSELLVDYTSLHAAIEVDSVRRSSVVSDILREFAVRPQDVHVLIHNASVLRSNFTPNLISPELLGLYVSRHKKGACMGVGFSLYQVRYPISTHSTLDKIDLSTDVGGACDFIRSLSCRESSAIPPVVISPTCLPNILPYLSSGEISGGDGRWTYSSRRMSCQGRSVVMLGYLHGGDGGQLLLRDEHSSTQAVCLGMDETVSHLDDGNNHHYQIIVPGVDRGFPSPYPHTYIPGHLLRIDTAHLVEERLPSSGTLTYVMFSLSQCVSLLVNKTLTLGSLSKPDGFKRKFRPNLFGGETNTLDILVDCELVEVISKSAVMRGEGGGAPHFNLLVREAAGGGEVEMRFSGPQVSWFPFLHPTCYYHHHHGAVTRSGRYDGGGAVIVTAKDRFSLAVRGEVWANTRLKHVKKQTTCLPELPPSQDKSRFTAKGFTNLTGHLFFRKHFTDLRHNGSEEPCLRLQLILPSSGEEISIYSNRSSKRYDLLPLPDDPGVLPLLPGLLPGHLVHISHLLPSHTTSTHFTLTTFSTLTILHSTGSVEVHSLPEVWIHEVDERADDVVVDKVRPPRVFRVTCHLVRVMKLEVMCVCSGCGGERRGEVCSYVGCHHQGPPVCQGNMSIIVEDGSGSLLLYLTSLEDIRRCFSLSANSWSQITSYVMERCGTLIYRQSSMTENSTPLHHLLHVISTFCLYPGALLVSCRTSAKSNNGNKPAFFTTNTATFASCLSLRPKDVT